MRLRTRRGAGRGSAAAPSRGSRRGPRRGPRPGPTPRRPASASGLRKSDCSAAPTTARPPPTSAAMRTRGRRTDHRMTSPISGSGAGPPSPRRARAERTTPPAGSGTLPRLSAARRTSGRATARAAKAKRRRSRSLTGASAEASPPARGRGGGARRATRRRRPPGRRGPPAGGSASRRPAPRARRACGRGAGAGGGPSAAPDPLVTRKTSGSAANAFSPARGTMPRRPSSRPTFGAAGRLDQRADGRSGAGRVGVGPVEDARALRPLQAARELGQHGVEARGEASGGLGRAHRPPEVHDRGADPGERVEPAHAVVAEAGLLEEPQEVGVGVLGDDDEIGPERDEPLEVGPRQTDGRGRDAPGHVRHVGVVGPAGHRDQPLRRQHLDEQLVGGQVERGHPPRRVLGGKGRSRGAGEEEPDHRSC